MSLIHRVIFFALVIMVTPRIEAQTLTFYGAIPSINLTQNLSKNFNFNFFASTTIDAFDRKIESITYPSTDLQLYIQPSLIYHASKPFSYAFSYTYQRNNPFRTFYVNENRLWQQLTYTRQLSSVKWTNRLRFEERFIENKITNQYPLSTRLRYQIGFTAPLRLNKQKTSSFYWSAYNEFYFSLSGAKNATYSENWSYLGLGLKLSERNKLEVGYLFQTLVRDPQQDLRFLHLAQITWVSNFSRKSAIKSSN